MLQFPLVTGLSTRLSLNLQCQLYIYIYIYIYPAPFLSISATCMCMEGNRVRKKCNNVITSIKTQDFRHDSVFIFLILFFNSQNWRRNCNCQSSRTNYMCEYKAQMIKYYPSISEACYDSMLDYQFS